MDTLIANLTVEDVIMITGAFFSGVAGFSLGVMLGAKR